MICDDNSHKQRLLNKVLFNVDTYCWDWQGSINKRTGYGESSIKGKRLTAHRLSYTLFRGEIPKGLVIDHLCNVSKCINPEHLEAVTQKENIKRSVILRQKFGLNKCFNGHEKSLENQTTDSLKRGYYACRLCRNETISKRKRRYVKSVNFSEKNEVDIKIFVEYGEKIFGKNNFKQAIQLKLYELDIDTHKKSILHARKYIEKTLSLKSIGVNEIMNYLELKSTKTRFSRNLGWCSN